VVLRYRALGACTYLALLYVWTNAVISTVIYKKNKACKVQSTMQNAITLQKPTGGAEPPPLHWGVHVTMDLC
ncbi:MAG: hypothetical protein RR612_09420, partial [Oscillospiraceae bacterium]